MWSALLPLLPLAAALNFPHLPTPQEALDVAGSILHPAVTLTHGNDMRLSSVPTDDHLVVTSAMHPEYKLRIKSHEKSWCDPDANSYSGYLDVGNGRDIFFYFFESRSKPSEDPVVMWINGGPGCSSALGLFMELGPCSVKEDPKSVNDTKVNPDSWNSNANIFFLDEPIGVGFSRAEHGQTVATTEEAARDIQAFVQMFFETFDEFKGRAFHMAGESYGGRYLPLFASAVSDGNLNLKKHGKTEINLQSVMIGNGITDLFSTTESYFDFQCTLHGQLNHTVSSIGDCVSMAKAVPKCHKMTQRACIDSHDYTECAMALGYCVETLEGTFFNAGVNPYDVSKPCTPQELSDSLCYSETDKITDYLNLPDVRAKLGVDKSVGKFSSCSTPVGHAFNAALDSTDQTWLYVAQLLEREVRVLNYVGMLDWICNHIGNERWMEKLQWSGQKGYNDAKWQDWQVKGKSAGYTKAAGNLSMVKIFGAGHMVPYDQGPNALAMLTAWLNEKPFA